MQPPRVCSYGQGSLPWGDRSGGQQGDIQEREEGLPGAHGILSRPLVGSRSRVPGGLGGGREIAPGLSPLTLQKALHSFLLFVHGIASWPSLSNPRAWGYLGQRQKAFNPQVAKTPGHHL